MGAWGAWMHGCMDARAHAVMQSCSHAIMQSCKIAVCFHYFQPVPPQPVVSISFYNKGLEGFAN
jgi:hypothetical protein